MLVLKDKSGWRFNARGGQLALEESVFLADDGQVRKSSQLVLRTSAVGEHRVRWAFKKLSVQKKTRRKAAKKQQTAPTLF